MAHYSKALKLLDAADVRHGRARHIVAFDPARLHANFTKPASQEAAASYARRWNDARRARWEHDDREARATAREAVEASPAVLTARRLADGLRDNPAKLRAFAKAAAARIATEDAVFAQAYGRAMPKEWWAK
jgi:hypothetical protein